MEPMDVIKPMQFKPETEVTRSGLVIRRFAASPQSGLESRTAPVAPGTSITPAGGTALPRRRLSGPDPGIEERIWPVRKHWGDQSWDENWSLYWLPLEFRNKRDTRGDPRFMDFFERLIAFFDQGPKLSQFTFFDSQLLHPYLLRHFVLQALDYFPMGAVGFRPEAGPCKVPDYDDVTKVDPHKTFSLLQEKQQAFGMSDLFPNSPPMLYYIVAGQEQARRELTGRGGYSFALSKQGQTAFFEATKQMLARNTSDETLLRMPIVAPVLSSASFTRSLRPDLERWFSLLDLYVIESPRDKGMVIASNRCLDEQIAEYVTASRLNESGRRRRFGIPRRDGKGNTTA